MLDHLVFKRLNLALGLVDCLVQRLEVILDALEELIQVLLLVLRHLVEDFLDLDIHLLVIVDHRVPHQLVHQIVALIRDDPHQLAVLCLLRQLHRHILDHEACKLARLTPLFLPNQALILRNGDLFEHESQPG